jgi:ribosomal protein S18 acetylase RimI-like enzyme
LSDLERCERNLRASASRGRQRLVAGPFAAYLSPASPDYLMSVALPVRRDAAWASAIEELDAVFRRAGRTPRLEFFAERHPRLAAALDDAGYIRESVAPAMTLAAGDLPQAEWRERLRSTTSAPAAPGVDPPGRVGADARRATSASPRYVRLEAEDRGTIDGVLAMQAEAFGSPFDASAGVWRAYMVAGLTEGWLSAGALYLDGAPASAAMLVRGGGTAELAGVATAAPLRGRGLATATCGLLLSAHFARGRGMVWLSAAEGAQGLYERLGFRRVGTQLNYGRRLEVRA